MDDCVQLQQLRSDEKTNQYLDRPKTISIKESEAFVEKIDDFLLNNKSVYWVITLKTDNILIGTICLWNFSVENDIIELGYELSPVHQGKGIMHEAVKKVTAYGFDIIKAKIIIALPRADNINSVNLLKKAHFQLDIHHHYATEADGYVTYYLLADSR